ncbi:MAG: hypothetical protein QXS27_03985 [Candidatus Jordarchaeaceae archaeon]
MKGSTVLLMILGISILLIGGGLFITQPNQTFFTNNYPARDYPLGILTFGYSFGDYFFIYMAPGSQTMQFIFYPLTTFNYFGGFLISNNAVNVEVFGISDLSTPLIQISNTHLATYFSELYTKPSALGALILNIENPSGVPAIVIGQSRQYTVSLKWNPMILMSLSLLALGAFVALVGVVGEKTTFEPLQSVPSTAGETVTTGLRIWKKIFASTVLPFGFINGVYELINLLGSSYSLTRLYSTSSTAVTEAYAIEYGLMFIGYFFIVLALGIVIKATSDVIEGKEPSLTQNFKHVLRRSWKMYIAYFVYGLIVGVGLLLLIIPGIWLAIIFSLVLPAIVVADNGPMESFGTSKSLTENDKLRTLGVLLASGLIALIASIPALLVYYFFNPTPLSAVSTFSEPITTQFITFNLPYTFACVILMIIGATTGIISPIILTTWFYALGGASKLIQRPYTVRPGEEEIVCPDCKRTIPKSKFCPYCGKKQT